MKIPLAYVVGENDERYPENARGMKLGAVVNNIRSKGSYARFKDELKAMGIIYEKIKL
jgi:hypothetical protein